MPLVPFGHALESMSCSHQTFFSKVWPNELHNSRYTGVSLARWHGGCRIACHRECVGETMQIVDHVIRDIRALLPIWQPAADGRTDDQLGFRLLQPRITSMRSTVGAATGTQEPPGLIIPHTSSLLWVMHSAVRVSSSALSTIFDSTTVRSRATSHRS